MILYPLIFAKYVMSYLSNSERPNSRIYTKSYNFGTVPKIGRLSGG